MIPPFVRLAYLFIPILFVANCQRTYQFYDMRSASESDGFLHQYSYVRGLQTEITPTDETKIQSIHLADTQGNDHTLRLEYTYNINPQTWKSEYLLENLSLYPHTGITNKVQKNRAINDNAIKSATLKPCGLQVRYPDGTTQEYRLRGLPCLPFCGSLDFGEKKIFPEK